MSERLFVYGTLKRRAIEAGAQPASIAADLHDCGGYLAVTNVGTSHRIVKGYLWEVPLEELQRLDAYEGVERCLYRRERVTTLEGEEAWVYSGDLILTWSRGIINDE